MAVAFSQWLDDVMPELPGITVALATSLIKRAVIDFVGRSDLWQRTTSAFNVSAMPGDITPPTTDVPVDWRMASVSAAWWNGDELPAMSASELVYKFGASWPDLAGPPQAFTQRTPDTVFLVPQPSAPATAALRLAVSLAPNELASDAPDIAFGRWRESIAYGAKGRAMLMSKTPWANPELGVAYTRMFDAAVAEAGVMAARASAGRPWRTKASRF